MSATTHRQRATGLALATLSAATLSGRAQADEVLDDAAGYRASRDQAPLADLRAFGQRLPLGDKSGVNVPLGFSFTFYGATHTSVGVTSEGYLTFGGPVTNTPLPIPDLAAPNAVIAPFWANLDVTRATTASVHVRTLGSAPARRFVAQWSDAPLAADPAARLTFQVTLFEGTNAIHFQYATLRNGDGTTGGAASGGTATIGIERHDGAVGLQVSHLAAGTVAPGDRIVLVPGPAALAELSVRSAVAAPGTEVEVSLDVSRPVRGLRGLEGALEVVPDSGGPPPSPCARSRSRPRPRSPAPSSRARTSRRGAPCASSCPRARRRARATSRPSTAGPPRARPSSSSRPTPCPGRRTRSS